MTIGNLELLSAMSGQNDFPAAKPSDIPSEASSRKGSCGDAAHRSAESSIGPADVSSTNSECADSTTINATRATREKKNKRKKHSGGAKNAVQRNARTDSSQEAVKGSDYIKYKTRVCRNWQQTGRCPYGEACVYAHGAKEVRAAQKNEAALSSLTKLAQLAKQSLGASNTDASTLSHSQRRHRSKSFKKPTHSGQAVGQRQLGAFKQYGAQKDASSSALTQTHGPHTAPFPAAAFAADGVPYVLVPVPVSALPHKPFVVVPSLSAYIDPRSF